MPHLRQLRPDEPLKPPEGLELARVSWVFARGAASKHYTLRQRGQRLCFEVEAPVATGLDKPGSPVGDIRATAPYVQVHEIVADGPAGEGQFSPLAQSIPLLPDTRLRLRTDHEELRLDSISCPEWAEAIGRDEQGLFVSWAKGQRRAYWVHPGPYPVFNRTGERLGDLSLATGYWCDAAAGLAQLREGFRQPAWAEDYGLDDLGLYADCRLAGVSQRMRWIAPGEFVMGSPGDEPEREDDETPHPVMLSQGLWLADITCTQALWQAVMGENPSDFRGEDRPVENVSWDDVQGFLARLNTMLPGEAFRLPTEAEWEYACRAGSTSVFSFGDQITPEQVNYDGNLPYADGEQGVDREETVDVKALPCNRWGLYQMHGNVWEWCEDWYGDYPITAVIDPAGPAEGVGPVLRGGGWFCSGGVARSALRDRNDLGFRYDSSGFRFARGQASSK